MTRKQWFIDRIGKRVYRNKTTCDCKICQNVYENGVIIIDRQHAGYIYDNECEYNIAGYKLRYFDTREEMLEFEKNIKK